MPGYRVLLTGHSALAGIVLTAFFLFPRLVAADNARDWQAIPINTPMFFTYYLNTESKTPAARVRLDTALLRFTTAFDMGNGRIGSLRILQPFTRADAFFIVGRQTEDGTGTATRISAWRPTFSVDRP